MLISACANADSSALPTRVVLPTDDLSPSLTPFATSAPITGMLDFWDAQNGVVSDTQDVWRFSAFAGDNITLRVVGDDILMTLTTDDNVILISGTDIAYTIPTTGFYRVVVAGNGDYQIGLGYADSDNPNAPTDIPITQVVGIPTPNPLLEELGVMMSQLAPNTPIQQAIRASDRQRYTFIGFADTYIQLEASTDNPQNTPRITLFDPDGEPIATDGGSGANNTARIRNIRLSEDGEYTVQLIGTGDTTYTLLLNATERLIPVLATQAIVPTVTPFPPYIPVQPQLLIAGERLQDHIPIRATFARPDGVYIYPIYADAGTIITVGASPETQGVRLRLEMVDPDGNIVTRATVNGSVSNGDTVIPAYPIAMSGVHQIFVTSENGILGDFILSYGIGATRIDRFMGDLGRDQTVTNRIDKRGTRDVWAVALTRGDTITLSATPSDLVFDPVLELVRADNPTNLVVIDDNGGGNRAPFVRSLVVPEDGLYLIRIYAKDAASLGSYSLVWRYLDRAATPTPPAPSTPLMTVYDSIAQDEYAFYPFQGYVGQKIEVEILGQTDGFDPVVALISPNGDVLIEADDSNNSLNPVFRFTIPADGVYRLRVNGYLSSGDFLVLISELF
ncbi:MAG: pre-peptidase C-terminal domain-containing protein [Anaerolineae bacterium]|nr:pre-peptidase C-terminal domain-containing protein [Anaerolineae bacterium]